MPRQDSIRACSAHAALSGHCNIYVSLFMHGSSGIILHTVCVCRYSYIRGSSGIILLHTVCVCRYSCMVSYCILMCVFVSFKHESERNAHYNFATVIFITDGIVERVYCGETVLVKTLR